MSANIVTVDEESLRKDIKNLVRKTVEETLNALLDEEASELVGAGRYERTAGREAYRSGHYARKLVTGAGEVELNVPKLRGATFQTAVIERYRRRETSVEEAIVEMYLAGVSTRRIEDVSELLWGAPVSSGTVSNLNERAFASIEAWRQRPLEVNGRAEQEGGGLEQGGAEAASINLRKILDGTHSNRVDKVGIHPSGSRTC